MTTLIAVDRIKHMFEPTQTSVEFQISKNFSALGSESN